MNIIIKNSLWLILDKLLVLVGGVLVSILVARYLGPDDFGKITLGITLAGLPIAISQWGGSQFIFSLAARRKKTAESYVINSELYRLLIYFIATIFLYIALIFTKYSNDVEFITFVIFSQVFVSLDLYQFVFNATFRSKLNASSNIISVLLSNAARVLFMLLGLNAYYFVLPYYISGFALWWTKRRVASVEQHFTQKQARQSARSFIFRGNKYLIFTLLSFFIGKINYIFLAAYFSYQELAIYSVLFMLAYAWIFFPQAIATSLLSKVLSVRDFEAIDVSFVILVVTVVSIPFIIVTLFFSDLIVLLTFGVEYLTEQNLLFWLVLSSLFSCYNFVANRVISNSKFGGKFLYKKSLYLLFFCSPISLALIDYYGLKGAVIAICVSEFVGCTLFNAKFNDGFFIQVMKKVIYSGSCYKKYFGMKSGSH
ncbi:Capsular polysaccharide biosynthesis protein CapF [Vibrio cholerae]|uniref:oligosaccharide flippase family protein n=1 Tax=Vibrio TaxID=662 RepID=UPI001301A665|nr:MULTISPECIES: oligosaccharide flippase family protein [Vibrio]BCN18148.1 putative O-antigen flippase [Vibrio cholerae]GHW44142.1 Capsular polysaccharide biosynthesis protein CapF [Vibrio cholerae]